MKYTDDLVLRSREIIKQVKEAEKLNKPIAKLVKEQIEIMEAHKDEFIKRADELGLNGFARARTEIQLYSNIKYWANKIGLPTEKYEKAIKDIRAKFIDE